MLVTGALITVGHLGLRVRRPGSRGRPAPDVGQRVRRPLLVAVLEARGMIGASEAGALSFELERAVAAGAERLLVDWSRVADVTTTGMNALLEARRQLHGRPGVIIVVLTPRIHHLFEALGLGRRFLLARGRREAAELLLLTVTREPAAGDARTDHARAA
jgi:anti-anti-sigma regulatory factor